MSSIVPLARSDINMEEPASTPITGLSFPTKAFGTLGCYLLTSTVIGVQLAVFQSAKHINSQFVIPVTFAAYQTVQTYAPILTIGITVAASAAATVFLWKH